MPLSPSPFFDCEVASQFHHCPHFRKPPCDPGRSDFTHTGSCASPTTSPLFLFFSYEDILYRLLPRRFREKYHRSSRVFRGSLLPVGRSPVLR
jgi:hypothetical protein